MDKHKFPLEFSVDYQKKPRDRASVFFRFFLFIPVFVLLALLENSISMTLMTGGFTFLFIPTALMIFFKSKYPRPWFDWAYYLLRFYNRAIAFVLLLRDEFPSVEDDQAVHLKIEYPDVKNLNTKYAPFKWIAIIPHFVFFAILSILVYFGVIVAWFAILLTGKYPKNIFDFVVGVQRYYNRIIAYAFLLVTDNYPPLFSLD